MDRDGQMEREPGLLLVSISIGISGPTSAISPALPYLGTRHICRADTGGNCCTTKGYPGIQRPLEVTWPQHSKPRSFVARMRFQLRLKISSSAATHVLINASVAAEKPSSPLTTAASSTSSLDGKTFEFVWCERSKETANESNKARMDAEDT